MPENCPVAFGVSGVLKGSDFAKLRRKGLAMPVIAFSVFTFSVLKFNRKAA